MTKKSIILAGAGVLLSSFAFSATRPGMGFAPLNPEFVDYTNRLHTSAGTLSVESGAYATGYIPSPVDMSHLRHMPENLRQLSSATDLPAQYDLRSIPGKLPPVRDQNPFGTCWTFAFSRRQSPAFVPA